ncbi:acyl-CoA thioesterase [Clostridia bacterium]|nr:acyl-CoA thioesterase [Clostridia bacterium]
MSNHKQLSTSLIMGPEYANLYGNVHGGEIMKIMDNTAGAAAAHFVRGHVVTARVDEIQFLRPVHMGDFVTCTGQVAYVGRTSIEIYLTVDVENLLVQDSSARALEAFFTLVAIGADGRPTPVPAYTPETEQEKALHEHVRLRREFYETRREEAKAHLR